MPIRRPRGPKPSLKHIPFLEAADQNVDGSPEQKGAIAAFLTLRVFEEWTRSGAMLAHPAFPSFAAARRAVYALTHDAETQECLSRVLDAIALMQDPDAQPVLPRLAAYAELLERRGSVAMACDVYATITRHVDGRAHLELAFDSLMKHGHCRVNAGDVDLADRAFEAAGMLAGRARDRARVLLARIAEANVLMTRGEHEQAVQAFTKIATEAAVLGDARVLDALASATEQSDAGATAR